MSLIWYRQNKRNSGRQDIASEIPVSSNNEQIAMRRAKPLKSNIINFLEEIGYEDIFNSDEIQEIRHMFNKNTANMTKNELVIDSIHKFDTDAAAEETKENIEETNSQRGNTSPEETEAIEKDHQLKQAASRNSKIFEHLSTYNLKTHLDTVRDGAFLPNLDQAVTVSEDCTIKLWDLKNIDQDEKQLTEDIKYNFIQDGSEFAGDPNSFYSYCTLRGHTGIITKVEVDKTTSESDPQAESLFYTAGIEGIIRVWKTPRPEEINQFGQDCDLSTKL
jgi:WD40 repeat protein